MLRRKIVLQLAIAAVCLVVAAVLLFGVVFRPIAAPHIMHLAVPPVAVPSSFCTEVPGAGSCQQQFCSQLSQYPNPAINSLIFDSAVSASPLPVRAQNVALARQLLKHKITMTQAFATMRGEGQC